MYGCTTQYKLQMSGEVYEESDSAKLHASSEMILARDSVTFHYHRKYDW